MKYLIITLLMSGCAVNNFNPKNIVDFQRATPYAMECYSWAYQTQVFFIDEDLKAIVSYHGEIP